MSKIFDRGQRFIKLILPLMIITAVCATIVSAGIALAGEESLEDRLSAYGLAEVSVSLSGNEVTVAYTQPVSEAVALATPLLTNLASTPMLLELYQWLMLVLIPMAHSFSLLILPSTTLMVSILYLVN